MKCWCRCVSCSQGVCIWISALNERGVGERGLRNVWAEDGEMVWYQTARQTKLHLAII